MKKLTLLIFVTSFFVPLIVAQEIVNTVPKPLTKEWIGFYNCPFETFNDEFDEMHPFYQLDNGEVWAIGNRFLFNTSKISFIQQSTGFTDEKAIDIISNNEIVYVLTKKSAYELKNDKWIEYSKKKGLSKIDKSSFFIKYDGKIIVKSDTIYFEFDGDNWNIINDQSLISKISTIKKNNIPIYNEEISNNSDYGKKIRYINSVPISTLGVQGLDDSFLRVSSLNDKKIKTCLGKDGKVWGIVLAVYHQANFAVVATVTICVYKGSIFSYDGTKWETFPVFDNQPLSITNIGDIVYIDTATGYILIKL